MGPIVPPVLVLPTGGTDAFAGLPGWRVHDGFDLAAEPWDLAAEHLLCVGVVDDERTGAAAITALTRGAGLALAIALDGTAHHRFLEDLHKISAPVAYEPPADPGIARLEPIQRDLLDALARGATVTAAAASLHVSRRTANRMLTDIRTQLGVDSTAAAVRRWVAAREA